MTAAEMIKEFLSEQPRSRIVSIKAIEVEAGMPRTTLHKYMTGQRSTLPEKHLPKLIEVLKSLGYKPE